MGAAQCSTLRGSRESRRGREPACGGTIRTVHPWAGQRVLLRADLRADAGPDAWGQFDTRTAARARGLATSGRMLPGSLVPLSAPPAWSRWVGEEREAFGRWVRGRLANPDAAALVGALAAGLRSELGPGWEERFARSGLAHVLSVSGLHVAALALVLAGLLSGLLRAVPALVQPDRPSAPGGPRRATGRLGLRRLHRDAAARRPLRADALGSSSPAARSSGTRTR